MRRCGPVNPAATKLERGPTALLTIESPFPDANVMLRLLEPPDSNREELLDRLYTGSYDKPFIVDNGRRRFLHFDFAAIQSAMEMKNPQTLALAYTRKMMTFLLFNRHPKRILLLGLGGGSLAKFCYGNLPAASLTAVEVSQHVIAMRDEFGIPQDDHRFRVVNSDGSVYISETTQLKDVILADACDRKGVAADLDSVDFYRKARSRLSTEGVFVVNICGDKVATAAHLDNLRDAFDDQLLTLPVRQDGNVIAFGFKEHRPDFACKQIELAARELKQRLRLDFPKYARKIACPPQSRGLRAGRSG
jgi:spermidine synthase